MLHPSAFVHPNANVHESAVIGPWCVVDEGAEIGENVVLESRVRVYGCVTIKANTHVYDGAILGAPPQDLKYAGEPTRLDIGENCIIREYTTLNRGTVQGGGCTRIAPRVLIMAYAHVGHDCQIGEGAVIANACQLGGHVRIGMFATLGGTTAVQQRNQVGAYAFVGGTLKVDYDVPPCSRAFGNPLRFASLNLHALRLHADEFPPERIAFFERAFRELYRGKRPTAEVIEELKKGPEPLFQAFFDEHWGGSLVRP
ncbi:acyl-ACP--UDP-N-acetylglucosamine O-acyltransferase [uncultured Fibrobacter sp.]|uniref:acyl-ACP--UDP-N-acetylglucosamine O-acyltransferase n=1 Tax=uncultured Fibrobacter sp. TaxID=261512 RepID=UPI0025CC7230|nr:acyl-ACP--UDP-N-acetylglucosamine O-acyltransferase [uncultured Fibrobacter sp.]